jgi:hypothetical protein
MQTLYVLSVLSFLALIWAAIAITRHIRRGTPAPQIDPPIFIRPARPAAKSQDRRAAPIENPAIRKEPIPFRDPVSAREQADWLNLQRAIGGHDLGNLNYPRAAGSGRPRRAKSSAQPRA